MNSIFRSRILRVKAFALGFGAILLCATIGTLESCTKSAETIESQTAATIDDFLPMIIGQKNFRARIAVSEFEKMRGLMGVKKMDKDDTMLFVYSAPQKVSFWMKDTIIPLDIGFFDSDGVLTEVKSMYPMNLNSVPSGRSDIKFCLETNAGWFEKNSIFPGAKLDNKLLNKALSSRAEDLSKKDGKDK